MDLFLKNAKVMRVVDGKRVDAGPIQQSKFAEHVQKHDRFGAMPIVSSAASAKTNKQKDGGKRKGAQTTTAGSGQAKSATTSVGTVQNAVTVQEVIDIRCKEAEIQQRAFHTLVQKLAEVDEQLRSVVRSRKNITVYKRLVDRRDALRAEISRQNSAVATTTDIVHQMIDFYAEQEQKKKEKQRQSEEDRGADILRQTDALLAATSVSKQGVGGMAIQFSTESVPRIAEVTFGAPIIESSEYARLEAMLGAQAQRSQEPMQIDETQHEAVNDDVTATSCSSTTTTASSSSTTATSSSSLSVNSHGASIAASATAAASATTAGFAGEQKNVFDEEEQRFQQQNALADIDLAFDEAVRADVTEHALNEVMVLAFLISPASRGWDAIDRQDRIDAERSAKGFAPAVAIGQKLLEGKSEPAHDASGLSTDENGRKRKYDLVTIGTNRGFVPTGSKIRNRLNIKMKDIRNTKNVSIFEFATVKKRKRTDQESETINFVRFIGERHFHDVQEAMTYDDPLCEECQSPLDIDMRSGMETCPNCGLTIYGGTGREIIPLEQEMHNKYQYLKVGHMKTILKRSQGKETTRIPQKVPNAVTKQLKMERANFDDVCAFRIKRTLKKLGLSRWYDHMHQIAHIVTGRRPHQFTSFEEEVILAIFEHLVEPYENHRPRNQENFPYYYYALHKVCQLLGYPKEVLRNFPILQNVEKHRQKERIWEKMMHDLGWPYYTS